MALAAGHDSAIYIFYITSSINPLFVDRQTANRYHWPHLHSKGKLLYRELALWIEPAILSGYAITEGRKAAR
jgi:hypothetical protein